MSTGKRLAKRSIIGTRVCAPGDNGKYYSGVIHAVKTPATYPENNNCINLTTNTRYSVRFDTKLAVGKRGCREYRECELIGPGFGSITGLTLMHGQKVFITFNGRETSGEVIRHQPEIDEVLILIYFQETPVEVTKRIDEVRLLESRKSARLMDQDTDFARLADMAGGERKRQASHTIDVPQVQQGSRKRRPSSSHDDMYDSEDDLMDECSAALVLMSLSCSPKSSHMPSFGDFSPTDGSSSSASWRSGTPSPPLSEEGSSAASYWKYQSNTSDEGIVVDYMDELPRKKKASNRMIFQCTWPGCLYMTKSCTTIEAHVRNVHLGPRQNEDDLSDHEEEFYYTEVELGLHHSSPPTMSHQDMARPPHEDPEYQRQFVGNLRTNLLAAAAAAANNNSIVTQSSSVTATASIPSISTVVQSPTPIQSPTSHTITQHQINVIQATPSTFTYNTPTTSSSTVSSSSSPMKHHKLSPRPVSAFPYPSPSSPPALLSLSAPAPTRTIPPSPSRRLRGENKKCRKVYGMEHRELWCTQCKWKKACSRFGD
ncbi:zinc finger protein 395 [Chrysoperla carnea]|uniref:zinc finger protein 395 n=1 Tax=Chrysoperla carnea TaxID=189513 RepID=UPI001D060DD2|nr:zinc finger protein 395 [Chrysoperla carnea]